MPKKIYHRSALGSPIDVKKARRIDLGNGHMEFTATDEQTAAIIQQFGVVMEEPKLFNEDEEGCSIEEGRLDEDGEFVPDKICYQCEKRVVYLFDDGRCKDCTRMTPEEVRGGDDSY